MVTVDSTAINLGYQELQIPEVLVSKMYRKGMSGFGARQSDTSILLDPYPIFAGTKAGGHLVYKDHMKFKTRTFRLDESAWRRYQQSVKGFAETADAKTRLFLMAHLQALNDALNSDRTYDSVPGGILVDEKNELELIGVPQYAMDYQVIYDFSKHLDVVLTYLCGIPYDELCDRLEANLEKFKLDYDILSTAIMTDNLYLLKQIPIGVLFGLSNKLDMYLEQGILKRHKCVLKMRGEMVTLPTEKWNEAELMYFLIGIQVWELLQFVFEELLKLYNQNKLIDPEIAQRITSKGYANVVFQVGTLTAPSALDITFNGMSFKIEPLVCQRGTYYQTLAQK